jgi:putative restriction endonuclease
MFAMRGYVGVTDQHWYEFLRAHPEQTEVNFWRPRDKQRFGAISSGEFFFFKLRAAAGNRVVGGGIFADWELLPLSAAWEVYGQGNGADSLAELRSLIGDHADFRAREDPDIGCILLRDVVFFPDNGIAGPPPEFARSLVQGKTYDIDDPRYGGYFDILTAQVLGGGVTVDIASWSHDGPMFSDPRLRRERLGQRGFQVAVLNAYHRRCAITGTRIWPALQAAHIRPVTRGGEHRLDNGVLLRSDVHTMFDRGYLGVDPSFRLRVSPLLRSEFGNGERFYAKAGEIIALPDRRADRPNADFLEWHMDEVFQAS